MGIIWNSGLQQQTQAVQMAFRQQMGRSGRATRKRGKRRAAAPKRKASSKSKVKRVAKKAARFVKGSAAAKRYMASLRRKKK